jgi:hypothetical protein
MAKKIVSFSEFGSNRIVDVKTIPIKTEYHIKCKYNKTYLLTINRIEFDECNGTFSYPYVSELFYVDKKGNKTIVIKKSWGDWWGKTESECLDKVLLHIDCIEYKEPKKKTIPCQ